MYFPDLSVSTPGWILHTTLAQTTTIAQTEKSLAKSHSGLLLLLLLFLLHIASRLVFVYYDRDLDAQRLTFFMILFISISSYRKLLESRKYLQPALVVSVLTIPTGRLTS